MIKYSLVVHFESNEMIFKIYNSPKCIAKVVCKTIAWHCIHIRPEYAKELHLRTHKKLFEIYLASAVTKHSLLFRSLKADK